jgi:hypothetical protein
MPNPKVLSTFRAMMASCAATDFVAYAEDKSIVVKATSKTTSGTRIMISFDDARNNTHGHGLIEYMEWRRCLWVTYSRREVMIDKWFPLSANTLADILTDFATWVAGRPIKLDVTTKTADPVPTHDQLREAEVQRLARGVLAVNAVFWDDPNGPYHWDCPLCGEGETGGHGVDYGMKDIKHKSDCAYVIAKGLVTNMPEKETTDATPDTLAPCALEH